LAIFAGALIGWLRFALRLKIMTAFSRIIIVGLAFLAATPALLALDGPTEFTIDLPFANDQATPSWLGHPATPAGSFASLDLPITPPDATAALLVTVFYQEEAGGFLRISWEAPAAQGSASDLPGPGEVTASSVLCDNFYEGIGMSNQRSLLVSADTMKQAGMLHFQTGDSSLGITRIKLEWLENSAGLASPAITDVLVTPANGRTQAASQLAGTPPAASDPTWQDRIVTVPITDTPVRIEQGVDFTMRLDSVPGMARVALKEAGLPWGQHLVVWLNDDRAGVIFPAVPELGDEGYPAAANSPYIGWREGTFLIPLNNLKAGDNIVQFSAEPDVLPAVPPDANAPAAPLALKDVSFQLDYPPAPAAVTTPVAGAPSTSPAPAPTEPSSSAAVPSAAAPEIPALNPTTPVLLAVPGENSPATSSSSPTTTP
jgi:hypothetical protein